MVDLVPADDRCPFCHFAQGGETSYNTRGDVVYEDTDVLAFVSPKWWPNNPGNVIVIPKRHFENVCTMRKTITTELSTLRLVALSSDDADAYYELVDRNRKHLTQHGDWTDLGEATRESVAADLNIPDGRATRFGIWLDERLIGRADLNPRAPEKFVLGYWLGGEFTGNGYATVACRALIEYGKAELGATDIFAGVTMGNVKSEAVLGRLGFEPVADRDTYTLFRLPLISGSHP